MQPVRDVIIAGGGLAGMTAALHLLRAGLHVTVIEKHPYPRHKVCGEYISNEVLPYLQWLDADPSILSPSLINRVCISAVSGKMIEAELPLGGFGVSRYTLDNFLMQKAVNAGCTLVQDTVSNIDYRNDVFTVNTVGSGQMTARFVIGAYGKRSSLDLELSRDFVSQRSPWIAVKGHYEGSFPRGLVALHNFNGGYCGVSGVEDNIINICYLVNADSFKQYKSITSHQQEVLYKNKHLKQVFENSRLLFDKPLTISQISFAEKSKVEGHVLMTGDSAGLIHPLCGNGMAMAIHSAKVAAEHIIQCYSGNISRSQLEQGYTKVWQQLFDGRMQAGKLLSAAFHQQHLATAMMNGLMLFPFLLPKIIRKTHGKPLKMY